MYYFDNYSSFFWSQFFGLPTFRIKFKWLLWSIRPYLTLGYFLDLISSYLLADSAPITLASFLFSCTFPNLIFHSCCFLCLLSSSPDICMAGAFLARRLLLKHHFLLKVVFLSVKFRMTCASYCMGILNYIHHHNTFSACFSIITLWLASKGICVTCWSCCKHSGTS